MKRVLCVSFAFPPVDTADALFPAKLVKYLPARGWEPWILTATPRPGQAETLPLEIPHERLVRAPCIDLTAPLTAAAPLAAKTRRLPGLRHLAKLGLMLDFGALNPLEPAAPWYAPAVVAGLDLMQRRRFQAIFSTAPPLTAHLVAATLSRLTGVRWIADFRASPTDARETSSGHGRQRVDAALVLKLTRGARSVVAASPILARKLAARLKKPVATISGGFDPEEAMAAEPYPDRSEPPHPQSPARLTLSAVGPFLPVGQDPAPLFTALSKLRDEHDVTPKDLAVRFWGTEPSDLPTRAARHGVSRYVRCEAAIPRPDALIRQRDATALLLLDWLPATGARADRPPTQAYEYLHARRPWLISGSNAQSPLAALAQELGVGRFCRSPAEIVTVLLDWLEALRQKGALGFAPNARALDKHRYDYLAGRLARVLEYGSVDLIYGSPELD